MHEQFSRYVETIEANEWLSPVHQAQNQERLLQNLVRFAYERSPFYRDRLAPLFLGHGIVDLSRWKEIPILERAAVFDHGPEMRAMDIPESFGPVGEFRTSGTLGTPLSVAVNGAVSTVANANIARLIGWFGFDRSSGMASIRSYPGDPQSRYPHGYAGKGWLLGHAAPHYRLHVGTPIEQQLEWLARVKASYLRTYPSNAMALAEAVSPEQGRDLGIKMVIAFTETIPDGTRELVAERFGARFASYYSCREIGMIGIECPELPQYHIAMENALVELVDDDGRAVTPGARGRVLVTGLNNYAMPFIRYALGDVAVEAISSCPCGRSLPVIERVEGRVRNAFTFRDGTRVWPRGWLAREMRNFVPFRQYQMVQLDHERIEFRYVPDGTGRNADLSGLTEYAKRMMHPSVEISVVPMQTLPRAKSGKFEDFISLVPAPAGTAASLGP